VAGGGRYLLYTYSTLAEVLYGCKGKYRETIEKYSTLAEMLYITYRVSRESTERLLRSTTL
jgi:hypothetical protein